MCGILCYTEHVHESPAGLAHSDLVATYALLANRGPDGQKHLSQACPRQSVVCHFHATLLWLRGAQPVLQPRLDPSQSHVLLWNGDVFGGGLSVANHESDTQVVLDQLRASENDAISDEHVPDVLCQIQGPFAFVYWRVASGKIWFGRDPLGRHSLLMGRDPRRFFLSSVVDPSEVDAFELPALGIYELDLALLGQPQGSIQVHAWREDATMAALLDSRFVLSERALASTVSLASVIATDIPPPFPTQWDPSSPSAWGHVLDEFLRLYRTNYVDPLASYLSESIRIRAQAQPAQCRQCGPCVKCLCARVGVLFSGGLDSVLMTALLCQSLPVEQSIDLMNVAFQKADPSGPGGFLVPDRLTGIQALQELKELYPTRRFNFLPVDVTKAELIDMREKRVQKLLYPLESVLDDSIGCALWFAARASTTARVLLLGMGADEQFGGYSRHRVRFQREGYSGLQNEMDMELSRISERNLGRDNRILSDHGIAARMPFLDENVVNFLASSVPIFVRTRPELPRGLGDKILLRALAWKMGLTKTALEPKRAIQFGSRIAKMENAKEKGSDKALRTS